MLIQHRIRRIDIIMHRAKRMKVLDPLENPVVVLSKRIIDLLTTTGQELILVQVYRIEVPGQGFLVSFEAKTSSSTTLLSRQYSDVDVCEALHTLQARVEDRPPALNAGNRLSLALSGTSLPVMPQPMFPRIWGLFRLC